MKKFTGIAKCKHCRTPLAIAKNVFDYELERHRVLAMWNVRQACEHVKGWPFFDYEIEWAEDLPVDHEQTTSPVL